MPLLGICVKDSASYSTRVFLVISIVVLFPIARKYKHSKHTSADEWIIKLWQIYTILYYLATKKNKTTKFSGKGLDLER